MLDNIIAQISEHFISILVTVTCGSVIGCLRYIIKYFKGIVNCNLAMSHDHIYKYAKFYITSGQITVEELSNLRYIYEAYHSIGGNSTGTALFEKCTKLPVVQERTVWNPYYISKDMRDIEKDIKEGKHGH